LLDPSPDAPPPDGGLRLVVPMRRVRARFEGLRMVATGLVLAAAGIWLLLMGSDGLFSLARLIGVFLFVQGVFQVPPGLLLLVRGRETADIELVGGRLWAFPHALAARRAEVVVADLRSMMLQTGRRGDGRLFLGTQHTSLVIESDDLQHPDHLPRLALALRETIRSLPDGYERLRGLDRQIEVARAVAAQRPFASWALVAVLVLAFLLQAREGALVDPLAMLRLGAGSAVFVEEGEWFRLVSANFLHAFEAHLVLNGLGLIILGGLLERLLGPWRLLIVYFVAALGGVVASMLWSEAPLMMGASTAVFGLAGGLLATERGLRAQLPPIARQSIRSLALVVVLNVALGFAVPFIDQAAHLGGFAAGMLAGYLLLPRDRRFRPLDPGGTRTWLAAVALALVFGAGLVRAAQNARDFDEPAALRTLLADEATDAENLNNFAWFLVLRPQASDELRTIALAMAEEVTRRVPEESAYLDTQAGALFRLGRLDEALTLQRRAFARRPHHIYAAHFGHFVAGVRPVVDTAAVPNEWTPGQPPTIELRGGAPGAITVIGTWTLAKSKGFFIARVERTGVEDTDLLPENAGLALVDDAEIEVRQVRPSLPEELEGLTAGTYQAWPDIGASELR
jgi:membrane associated rhomboid family serine protease